MNQGWRLAGVDLDYWVEIAAIDTIVRRVDQRNFLERWSMDTDFLRYATPARVSLLISLLMITSACTSERDFIDSNKLNDFAARYTAAWCSQNAANVASFFEEHGSLKINDGAPAVGRGAITKAAQGFMTAFPDLVVKMDSVNKSGTDIVYHWTLTGTYAGPGGTSKPVRISGFEQWRLGTDGLIAESKGHFDAVDYQRQLDGSTKNP